MSGPNLSHDLTRLLFCCEVKSWGFTIFGKVVTQRNISRRGLRCQNCLWFPAVVYSGISIQFQVTLSPSRIGNFCLLLLALYEYIRTFQFFLCVDAQNSQGCYLAQVFPQTLTQSSTALVSQHCSMIGPNKVGDFLLADRPGEVLSPAGRLTHLPVLSTPCQWTEQKDGQAVIFILSCYLPQLTELHAKTSWPIA